LLDNLIMASKDRILRQKEETKTSILHAAFAIVKEEGWEGLNMRKIADRIEYTAPIIYEYYSNKQAILQALTEKGFYCLAQSLKVAEQSQTEPSLRLEAMWVAFWNFAFENRQLYQVMYGVEMKCCTKLCYSDTDTPYCLLTKAIRDVMEDQNPTEEEIKLKYYTFFSVIHGLISINLIGNGLPDGNNEQIFKDAVAAIINSLYTGKLTS